MNAGELLEIVQQCGEMATDDTNPTVWGGLANALLHRALADQSPEHLRHILLEYKGPKPK